MEPLGGDRAEPVALALHGSTTGPWLNFRRAPMGDIIEGLPRGTSLTIQETDAGTRPAHRPAFTAGSTPATSAWTESSPAQLTFIPISSPPPFEAPSFVGDYLMDIRTVSKAIAGAVVAGATARLA